MSSLLAKSIAGSLVCFTAMISAEDASSSEHCPGDKKHYRATVRHIEGGGIGYSQGYTTFEAFLAPDPGKWIVMPFLDARGHVFDKGKWAANAGLGIRKIFGDRAYGINTYYDYRNTSKLHYNQIGVGLETLGKLWDIRINGYFPVGKKITTPYDAQFGGFSGHSMFISGRYQYALKGTDAEVGFHFGQCRLFDFYAATGPYYYRGQIGPNVWGGKGRIGAMYKDYITLEISDSYDSSFHNRFQGQISFTLPFSPKSRVKKTPNISSCKLADALTSRMVQSVGRQEIIPVDSTRKNAVATDPATGQPLFFVFVNNTSSSLGTYESPYPTLALAQANSSPGDIIYVFPGDGTTTGMDSGISLKANQKFWGSGISHSTQTGQGTISIPVQSSSSPTITNTDVDTDGNVITLATNNAISGFSITSALNDAIYGSDPQSLEVSSCTIENTTTYAIEASFSSDASISLTNNQFLNNVNGVFLTLNGTSTFICSDNTFSGQTSISSVPLEISAGSNVLVANIQNNIFNNNTTGSIRLDLNNALDVNINLLNNTITNNGTGSQASLGSSFVILSNGTIDNCSVVLRDNVFSDNASNALYLHTSGAFTTLAITASTNTMSNNGGSALVLATPVDTLTLVATDNVITECNDNGIAVISSGLTSTGNITINNNIITNIGNTSNGIAINQDFSTLNLTLLNNAINSCEGTGIISFAPTGIDSLALNISGNTISNCQNLSSNAASGLDIEQFNTLSGTFTNNSFFNNVDPGVLIGSAAGSPSVCLEMTGNNTDGEYVLSSGSGVFNLTPCDVTTVNTGIITQIGTITFVQSCPDAALCPP